MMRLLIIGFGFLLASCSVEDNLNPYPCLDGNCNTFYTLDETVQPNAYQDQNGYWHIEYYGVNYFTIRGELAELHDEYVINGVPLVESQFDTDTWVVIDGLTFVVPTYSYLGWFTNGDFDTPISYGDYIITLDNLNNNHAPLNVAGYQINKNFCWECPYAPTILGSKAKYTYNPRQQLFMDERMVGDTINVHINTIYNSDLGHRVNIEDNLKIIIQ
tara:strand:+ start:27 stop:674 length:648 start_codon:yes stop_codon:yes gene_type:complete